MKDHSRRFLELATDCRALAFGQFTLKSGRVSPYFFNAGAFNTGRALAALADCYADAIADSGLGFDVVFGPAYKGIPLAATVAVSLAQRHGIDAGFAYNRKEAKDHGEGGSLVGAALAGRVLVVDDVISAGTAAREALDRIRDAGAVPVGMVVALDRQELGTGPVSAVDELQAAGLRVVAVARLDDLVGWLRGDASKSTTLSAMLDYRERYGTN